MDFDGDDIVVEGERFKGTPGFWALIISKNPSSDKYTNEDKKQYKHLLIKSNAVFKDNNPKETRAKGNYQGNKWNEVIKPIWQEIKPKPKGKRGKGGKGKGKRQEDPKPGTSGTGLKILPSDPNALIDRFDLLFSSKKAGHTGVKNEIVAILDELKRQGVINVNEYKKLNSLIKK